MNKLVASISAVLMLGGLVGCGANDAAQDITNSDSPAMRVGFNSNDNQQGAFTNINDRGTNDQRIFDQVDAMHMGRELGDGGAYSQGGTYGHNDFNFHGQLNTSINGQPTSSYNSKHDYVIAQRIADRIEHIAGVNDVATVIDGDTILVAIDTNDNDDTTIENEVRRIAEGMSEGRNVKVVSDEGVVSRVRSLNNGTTRETRNETNALYNQ